MREPISIYFDLDGTLMENPFLQYVFPEMCECISSCCGASHEEVFRAIVAENESRLLNANPPFPLVMDWDDIFKSVSKDFRVVTAFDVVSCVKKYAGTPYSYILDDATVVLSELRQQGIKTYVASMGLSKYQVPVLDSLGLLPLFDGILTPDITGYLKTDVRFFKSATSDMRIMVGDKYVDDVVTPAKLNFATVLKIRTHKHMNDNFVDELKPFSPLERSGFIYENLNRFSPYLTGKPVSFTSIPNAVILSLDELPKVIELLAR